ncbi:transcriptional regulator MelR [Photobacterium lutimaris]|uniref:Transcriptional regulator MelR n=1 Tax=Photobacterium lutimaris TaxID=388278 RepID=A0A2T3J2M8_9GAMM|nr:transcriptional regulator MelR [Photobacterium lutimaris]PSU35552.1 transcriptional regulator MelR [Photobacterium lutimaris]TDR78603.1 AraC family transcriptional regulator [Photobacterium lutimaris]
MKESTLIKEEAYISPLGLYSSYEQIYVELRQPHCMDSYHWHGQVEVNIPFEGDVEYLINGDAFTIKDGHIGLFWGTTPHKLVNTNDTKNVAIINLPTHMLFSLPLDKKLIKEITHGAVIQSAAQCFITEEHVSCWVKASTGTDISFGQLMIDEIALMIKRMSLTGWETQTCKNKINNKITQVSKQSQYYVQQILDFISNNHNKPITVRDISNHVGLHSNYVMSFFQKVMNMTIKEYITSMRINHARALLVDTNRTIMDISLSVGFNSTSRFYDNFNKYLNMTPTQFRDISRNKKAI